MQKIMSSIVGEASVIGDAGVGSKVSAILMF